ncbi:unnamed protein product [Fusarium graminearum]|nr:unnamed protein product [Fusarium graminearum]
MVTFPWQQRFAQPGGCQGGTSQTTTQDTADDTGTDKHADLSISELADRLSSLIDNTRGTKQPTKPSPPQHDTQRLQVEPVGDVLQGTGLRSFKSTSPQLDAPFKDIMVKYNDSLYDYIAKREKDPGTILVKFARLGFDPRKTEPHIVIQCNKRVGKMAKKFFAQRHVKEDLLLGLKVIILDKPPVEVANDDTIDVLSDSLPDKTMCGMRITLSGGGKSVSCTLGGVIIVKTDQKRMYGLIAGHPLKKLRGDPSGKQPTYEVYGSSSEDDEDSDSSNTSADTSVMSSKPVHSDIEGTNEDDPLQTKLKIGTVVSDTSSIPSDKNYDWALIDLNQKYALSNIVIRNPQFQQSDFEDFGAGIRHYYADCQDKNITKEVLVIKQDNPRMAKLSLNTSSLVISPGSGFVNAHDVTMKDGSSFSPGDSGLWVVDANTLGLYGHVVSVDAFGEAQVMPIQSTLQDIKRQLKASRVSLATASSVERLKVALKERSPYNLSWPTTTEARLTFGPTVSSEGDSLQDCPPWNTTYSYGQDIFFNPSISQLDQDVQDFSYTSSTTVEPLSTEAGNSAKNTNEGYQYPTTDQDPSSQDLLQQSSVEYPVINSPSDFDRVPAPQVPEKEERNARREDDKPTVQQWLQEQDEVRVILNSLFEPFKLQSREGRGHGRRRSTRSPDFAGVFNSRRDYGRANNSVRAERDRVDKKSRSMER